MTKSGHTSAVDTQDWEAVRQLGKTGKEGMVYLVRLRKGKGRREEHAAMKQFKAKKSAATFRTEARFTEAAAHASAAPQVYEIVTASPPRLVMQLMECTVVDLAQRQGGQLSESQQRDIVETCLRMDAAGIYHNDPNPLNLMVDADGAFRWVDFGHSVELKAKHGQHPNVRALLSSMPISSQH